MTLTKAIEIQGNIILYQYSASHSDEGDAIKLGMRALQRLRALRTYHAGSVIDPLEGETIDQP